MAARKKTAKPRTSKSTRMKKQWLAQSWANVSALCALAGSRQIQMLLFREPRTCRVVIGVGYIEDDGTQIVLAEMVSPDDFAASHDALDVMRFLDGPGEVWQPRTVHGRVVPFRVLKGGKAGGP